MGSATEQLAGLNSLVRAATSNVADDADDCEYVVIRLFDEVGGSLLRYVLSLGLRRQDGEDILQETFLALFRHLQQGRSRENLKSWLFRVAHNQALKRRSGDKLLDRNVDFEEVIALQAGSTADAEDAVVFAQSHRRLQAVLHALPERDRRCLILKSEGMRYREIARTMRMSLGAVSQSISRTLALMARVEGS